MAYDPILGQRLRAVLANRAGISEMRMMGGLCFFLNGNMLCGASRDKGGEGRFMFRVGKAQEEAALRDPAAGPIIHGSRKLGGFVRVGAQDCDDAALQGWVRLCLDHAASLPPKQLKERP